MPKKKGLLDAADRLFERFEEAFEIEGHEQVITESQETTTSAKGELRQSMLGQGYEIEVRKPRGKSPRIAIRSDVPLSVTINGEVVWTTKKSVD